MADHILLVEDDEALSGALARYLKRSGAKVHQAATCREAFDILADEAIDVVLSDIALPDGLGFEVVDRAAGHAPAPPVIVMTGDDSIDNAIMAVQHGAADFLLKPFSFEALDSAIERAEQKNAHLGSQSPGPSDEDEGEDLSAEALEAWRAKYAPNFLGKDRSILEVFSVIKRVCDTDCSILVTGDSGTGKELVARAIHEASDRRKKPFVTVNCAAIPDNLLESELFGHTKGAFTGATQQRVGRFAAAEGGTIFLDEIGEMPLALQAKLLRVLQEKEVTPVGESKTLSVDVRVVAATNRDIEEMVERGQFREDLLYRLNVIPIELPALRERRSDIPALVEHFVTRANDRRDRRITGISRQAMEALCTYEWPGNIRQLENTIERMVVLRSEGELDMTDLPPKVRNARSVEMAPINAPTLPEEGINLKDAVENFENALILQALERSGWNKNRAASILQMNRTTLVEKLKKKNILDGAAA